LSGLSGGNQQKVVIGKWLGLNPRIVILDEPTKGIDVGAKQAVYALIAEMVAEGLSVILVSSELPEVMNLAHRVIVMKRGRAVAELERPHLDAEAIVAAASGLHAAADVTALHPAAPATASTPASTPADPAEGPHPLHRSAA
jgi:rhamnose transport system ATP-binding protein